MIIDRLNELEKLLVAYISLTSKLTSADIEKIEETDKIIEEREKLINQIETEKQKIVIIIDQQTPEKAQLIRKILAGESIITGFSDEEKKIQTKALILRSLQSDIMGKEAANQIRFKRKYDEIRGKLEELQQEKKKVNFYQNVAGENQKGAKFDLQN